MGTLAWWLVGTQLYPASVIPNNDLACAAAADDPTPPTTRPSTPAAPPVDPAWLKKQFDVRESQLAARGQFGDMFGAAGALFGGISAMFGAGSVLLVIFTLRQQQRQFAHQSEREDKRDRNERDRVLLEISQEYWTPQIYEQRETAWELVDMLRPAFALRYRGDESDRVLAIVDEFIKPRSVLLLEILVEWYVVGRSSDRDEVCDRIIKYQRAWDSYNQVDINDADRKEVLPMVRGLGHVLHLFGTHAAVLMRDRPNSTNAPPLTDFMGNQWSFWGEVLMPFIRKCQLKRDSLGQGYALWERWLPDYDDYYHRRGSFAQPRV